jgi:hypothetical protein
LKIIKESGLRLRKKARTNMTVSVLLLIALVLFGLTTDPYMPFAVSWGAFTNFYALLFAVLALGAVRFYRKYQNYQQGFQGENRVSTYLRANFSDDNFLIDDLVYVNDSGHKENIDHIVLNTKGIFVLETKDYRGKIKCKGSFWAVPFPYGRSPSKQARSNAWWVKKKIDESGILQEVNLWVKPIVVFSNPDVDLDVLDPEAEVVKLDDLAESINSFNNGYNFSSKHLKDIGENLVKASLPG